MKGKTLLQQACSDLAVANGAVGQVAEQRRQHADVADGDTHVAAGDDDTAAELVGADAAQAGAGLRPQLAQLRVHHRGRVVALVLREAAHLLLDPLLGEVEQGASRTVRAQVEQRTDLRNITPIKTIIHFKCRLTTPW